MAGVKGVLTTGGGIATGTTVKTLLQLLAASDHRAVVTGFGVSFAGTTANDARILVELLFQTSAGTMTSQTCVKRNPADPETLQTTGRKTATVEPTDSSQIVRTYYVDPEWGYTELVDDLNDIQVPGGYRLGLRVTAGTSVNATAWLDFVE